MIKPNLVLLVTVALAAACGSNDQKPTLTAINPATTCAGGGITIASGVDDDGDNVLDPEEIDSSETVCSTQVLQRVDTLPPGADCQHGGTAVRWGVDDSENGALEDAEIDYSDVTCNAFQPFAVPPGAEGTAEILLDGGAGTTGYGGTGGHFRASLAPSGGGYLQLYKTGAADASFTLPSHTPDFGAQRLPVTGTVSVQHVLSSATALTVGSPYTYESGGVVQMRIYVSGAINEPQNPRVTGIEIAKEGQLILRVNVPYFLELSGDVVNEGMIMVPDIFTVVGAAAAEIVPLKIECRAYIGLPGSVVKTASGGGGPLEITARDLLRNEGTIDARGFAVGGIRLVVEAGSLFNTGSVAASASPLGLAGGDVMLQANGGMVGNSGAIDSSGGPSSLLDGGSAGAILLSATPGDVRNSNTLTANGGAWALELCGNSCIAGAGGTITLKSNGGAVRSSAAITATGGSATGTGCGGSGGALMVSVGAGPFQTPSQGNVELSGGVNLSGGGGESGAGCLSQAGGEGGRFAVDVEPVFPLAQSVSFYGYAHLYARGGVGLDGAYGGLIELRRGPPIRRVEAIAALALPLAPPTLVGGIVNFVDMDVSGGDAASNADLGHVGGFGGNPQYSERGISFFFDDGGEPGAFVSSTGANRVVNGGALTNRGGRAAGGGGGATSILLHGPEGVESSGAIEVRGGAAFPGLLGGDLGTALDFAVALSADAGPVVSSGPITAAGGDGRGGGGAAHHVCLEGTRVTSSGAIAATGGNTFEGGVNGNGADVRLTSYLGGTTSSVTPVTSAGTGGTGGVAGSVFIDGQVRCWDPAYLNAPR